MAVMKSEPDGKHPSSHYLFVGDPEVVGTWKLRVKDASGKPNNNLMGDAYQALHGGFRGNKVQMSDSDKKKCLAKLKRLYAQEGMDWPDTAENSAEGGPVADNVATFALSDETATVDLGDWVIKSGKIFEAGDYPDKFLSVTEDDLNTLCQNFSTVPLDIQHVPSPLDGHLGELWNVRASGKDLIGDIAVPAWLSHLLPEMKVSTTWDIPTKTLTKLAIVNDPRVPDAAMLAAFSASPQAKDSAQLARPKHNTKTGQAAMQRIHNATVQSGAVCTQAKMASRHEATAIQSIHDMSVEHGAVCDDGTQENAVYPSYFSESTKRKKNTMAVELSETKKKSLLARILGLGAPDDETEETDPVAEFAAQVEADDASKKVQATFAAKLKEANDRAAALATENARLATERIAEQATAFAALAVAEGRALPAEQEAIVACFTNAALADRAGSVTFSNGAKAGMLESYKASVTARATTYKTLTQEQVPSGTATFALENKDKTDGADKTKVSDERRKELLEKTQVGKFTIEQQNKKA